MDGNEEMPKFGIILDPFVVSSSVNDPRVDVYRNCLEDHGITVFDNSNDANIESIDLLSATGSIRSLRNFGTDRNLVNIPCFDMFTPELHYYSKYQYNIPAPLKLNSDGVILPFSECSRLSFDELCDRINKCPNGSVFMRPDPALKVCEAQVLCREQWETWKQYTTEYTGVTDSTFLWWFPVEDIKNEYRCFMHNNKCISASEYSMEGEPINMDNDSDLKKFSERVSTYLDLDDPCYVIDVAKVKSGFKVIELNCASTSGLYDLNLNSVATSWYDGLNEIYIDRYKI